MMSSKRFKVCNAFNGLEEAVNAILEDSDSDSLYDFAIIPPEPSVLTDEEEGGDEIMVAEDLPRDVPGNIEVFRRDNNIILTDDNDSSDDEPLADKVKRSRSQLPAWRKCLPTYSSTSRVSTDVLAKQEDVKKLFSNLNPVQVFEKIFDEEVTSLIISNTILYANQNNRHNFQLDTVDLKKFIGVLILSGYHKLPREDLYWSYDEDVGMEMVSKSMSRQRYRDIKRNLHLVNNNEGGTTRDKMFKIRPLADVIMSKFLQWGVLHEHISIDESMVKYFGHHPAKQFIRGKPVRFGFKNWVAASSTGYCYTFDFYCGKSEEKSTDPLGSRVVKKLLEKMETDSASHQVFFDNFFTSYNLLVDLKQKGFRATGTIRENRTKKCPLRSAKEMKKEERASYDYRFDKQNEILLVKWKDNSVCTMATNYDTIEPLGAVKRWSSTQRQKIDVNIPKVFQSYNKHMGGVDELDQSISLYRIAVRGKKWWWALFTYIIDMAIANAWRLYVMSHNDSMDQLLFRRSIARYYLRQYTQNRARLSSSLVLGLPQDGIGHYPKKLEKQLRCVLCHARVRWQCKKCLKTLCIEKQCFETFHL